METLKGSTLSGIFLRYQIKSKANHTILCLFLRRVELFHIFRWSRSHLFCTITKVLQRKCSVKVLKTGKRIDVGYPCQQSIVWVFQTDEENRIFILFLFSSYNRSSITFEPFRNFSNGAAVSRMVYSIPFPPARHTRYFRATHKVASNVESVNLSSCISCSLVTRYLNGNRNGNSVRDENA